LRIQEDVSLSINVRTHRGRLTISVICQTLRV